MNVLVDSYGWIEFFSATGSVNKYAAYIVRANFKEYFTPSIVVYEVYKKLKKELSEETALEACAYIISNTTVVNLSEKLALEAADLSISYGLSMADSIIFATAKATNSRIITGDYHFKNLEPVEFIK